MSFQPVRENDDAHDVDRHEFDTIHEADEWDKHNLLSLDGGGIRGYWSLLVLRRLMELVGDLEENYDKPHYHSFSPAEWPAELFEPESTVTDNADSFERDIPNISRNKRYLPCHYFDLIGGSSTGALIAIMLGRLRMNVPDCLNEYETFGNEVFGKPRVSRNLRFIGIGNQAKYDAAKLQRVFEDVTERRSEKTSDIRKRITFRSGPYLCRTLQRRSPKVQLLKKVHSACLSLLLARLVTTIKRESNMESVGTLYLIRSYDHTERKSPEHSLTSTRQQTMRSNRTNTGRSGNTIRSGTTGRGDQAEQRLSTILNYGVAQDFEIWEVARAATAAPWYFEPLKIDIPPSQEKRQILLTDGGFDRTNNPALECTREIEDLYGRDSIDVVVSVGTARKNGRPTRRRVFHIIPWIKQLAQQNSDPENVHRDLQRNSRQAKFPYFRLNHPDGLDIELDEWEPKGRTGVVAGSLTIQRMTDSFNAWAMELDNDKMLRGCATKLVERRRRRIEDKDRWDRFATAARYVCRLKRCEGGSYYLKEKFREHLRTEHSLIEDRINEEEDHCRQRWVYRRNGPTMT